MHKRLARQSVVALSLAVLLASPAPSWAEEKPKFEWKMLKIRKSCLEELRLDAVHETYIDASGKLVIIMRPEEGPMNGCNQDEDEGRLITACVNSGSSFAIVRQRGVCWAQVSGPRATPGRFTSSCLQQDGSMTVRDRAIVCTPTPAEVVRGAATGVDRARVEERREAVRPRM